MLRWYTALTFPYWVNSASFLKQCYLHSVYPTMEKAQKSLGCDYKRSQNGSKAKNKIWKKQAIALFTGIAKPWNTPKRPAWQLPNPSTSPSTVTTLWPTPAHRAGWAVSSNSFQIKAKATKEELRWTRRPTNSLFLTYRFITHSSIPLPQNQMGVHNSRGCLGRLPPHRTAPGRGLRSLPWSSCAPLIPKAHSAIQL